MNKLFIQIGLTATIFLSIVAVNQINAQMNYTSLDEDQAVICIKDVWTQDFENQGNEKVACTIIQDLDLLNDAQEKYIYGKFMAEQDTFNLSDLTGMID